MSSTNSLTGLQQFVLVFFRFAIGWHLFYQGLGKYQSIQWSSKSYLSGSTGPFAGLFQKLADSPNLLSMADHATVWGLMVFGILLMLGLLTRTATVGAMLLLALFYLAQPPFPHHGFGIRTPDGSELYVNKVSIEITALVVSLVFDTGRISGLDLLVPARLRRKEQPEEAGAATSAIQDS